jgi:hypothetical protein
LRQQRVVWAKNCACIEKREGQSLFCENAHTVFLVLQYPRQWVIFGLIKINSITVNIYNKEILQYQISRNFLRYANFKKAGMSKGVILLNLIFYF